MQITINATPEETAALILAIQGRHNLADIQEKLAEGLRASLDVATHDTSEEARW